MKQIKLIFISLILWSVAPMLQSCDKNDDENNRQQDTTLNESNNLNNGGDDSNGDGNGGSDNGGDNGNGGSGNDDSVGFKSCPDSNHPHMINLSLPSGTLWACCNVGGSKPEEYGNYYAWGETQPKSVYDWNTYQFYNSNTGHVNIGSDIAGTSYDAATANWGAPWRMPSLAQIKELLNNTTSTWTTENGVYGRKFTGSNGGTVFLPAAGDRWNSGLNYAGSYGKYWSSSLNEGYPHSACGLGFDSGDAYWSGYNRSYGHSVRPVR